MIRRTRSFCTVRTPIIGMARIGISLTIASDHDDGTSLAQWLVATATHARRS